MEHILLGVAPTRRSIFSAPDALRYAGLIRKKLEEMNIAFIDLTWLNDEGLLYDDADVPAIVERFRRAEVSGLFVPHCNFGTEYAVANLARQLGLPTLLWGPRDECPDKDGIRLRDSQCGLFATGKVLRRFQVPFTYLNNCRLDDQEFEDGISDFLAVCNTVNSFHKIRILQISTRPFDFFSTMCNEGELLERFGIRLAPIPMTELMQAVNAAQSSKNELENVISKIYATMNVQVDKQVVEKVAALKLAIQSLAQRYECTAAAIQCWNALQSELGIMPCAANSLLNEEGLPVVCETDIHGAITAVLVEAASKCGRRSFFADWTVRHPDRENGELLQHCGPWPISAAAERPTLGYPLAFDHPGAVSARAKPGMLTLARFDGDNGQYSLLLGNAKAIDGPYTKGTYLWIEVANLKRLEAKLVEGPYIHHCVGIHEDIVPVLYEACKYLHITPDLYDDNDEEIRAYLRGER